MPTQSGKRSDLPTVIAVAVVAYAASSVVHELIGHGTGCLLTGVKALRFTALEAIALWTEWPCCQCPRWDWCFLSVSETVEIHRLFLFSLALCKRPISSLRRLSLTSIPAFELVGLAICIPCSASAIRMASSDQRSNHSALPRCRPEAHPREDSHRRRT